MLRHLKAFFNIQFKIKECEDDVFSDSDSEEESEQVEELSDGPKEKFPRAFIFTCIGIGLTNFARKIE